MHRLPGADLRTDAQVPQGVPEWGVPEGRSLPAVMHPQFESRHIDVLVLTLVPGLVENKCGFVGLFFSFGLVSFCGVD